MTLSRIVITWLLFLPIPIINGLLREYFYKKRLGEFGSNIVGFVVLSVIFVFYAYLSLRDYLNTMTGYDLFLVGLCWLIFTLLFEFGMGFFSGRSMSYMLADYNVLKGRLWPLVLVIIATSPFIVASFR